MEILKKLIICAFICIAALRVLVHAQSQSGFISIDCGISENSGYTDKVTGLNYTSDATFIETGVGNNILSEYKSTTLEQQFLNVRSFPEGKKNCYTLKTAPGEIKFFIRARFMYGNYDGKGKVPSFNLILGADVWDSVELEDASPIVTKEIIHIPKRNYVCICLENTGSGTPFISVLELRPLSNSTYQTQSGSLLLYRRWDVGSTTNQTFRYKDDIYDRIWTPYNSQNWTPISSPFTVHTRNIFQPPSEVMQTAIIPENGSDSLQFSWEPSDPDYQYYLYLYIAEVQNLPENQIREMNIFTNGMNFIDAISCEYLYTNTLYSAIPLLSEEKNVITINKTMNSTLLPILNALEIYRAQEFPQLLTDQQDVDAIMNIKSKYGVKRSNWQGDPCAPQKYLWQGLNCSYDDRNLPRIISLNLSSSGIDGKISPDISKLTSIQILDLSNNNFTGPVPDFLLQLPYLKELILTGNKLEGSIPAGLWEKQKDNLLSLSVHENPDLCPKASCAKKNKLIIPLLEAAVSLCILLTVIATLWGFKRRKQGKTDLNNNRSLELKNRRFSYSDVVKITNNFETVIGKGGFGTVYLGYVDDNQVAVKMLSPSSAQGYKQFQAEVELLMRVHHKNLTTLVGYCDEGINMGLIYEFMANGNLEKHLLGDNEDILSWEGRLKIAVEAAQGLEYLHNGCKPPIFHRDVKSTNILLNENFQAKLADFGVSRVFLAEGGTHVSTTIVGTPGYLDPEYYISNRLTEKSDVYSFGVVLLEIITSKSVVENNSDRTHISQWVSFMLAKADIKNVIDPRLQGDFNLNSVQKAVEIAMACISPSSANRPTMNQIVNQLNYCLAIEMARKKVRNEIELKESIEMISSDLHELSSTGR
ncbi:putative leucine-rich repeat receptor-like protein kinase At2g19210 [Pistacia vera]|uniref:putative leucine-rich repeat receptor-like protein kinase At2g19210 n=1 Tax=Pistacia vera TaxID=55513 RepID=UPI001262C072|nr:putative leucine-rich repeat receptor-like protein kinase At2g19210 [Pistacia vera]